MARSSAGARRKPWIARLVSAALLVGALVLTFLAMNSQGLQRAEALTTTIGLVNEDLPAEFNGTEYTFGANFVDRISKDTEYNWTVLSRSVAEKAFTDGSVDAVIYLPQSFSSDILTLQELDPTKATVEYKLRPQADARADRLLDSKVVSIVSDFNQGVVKMYSASLADNIAEADGQMHSALSNQEALIAALTADVQEPFSTTMPSFENFIESTSGLKDVNATTVEAQNSFTESVTDTLTSTGEALSGKLPEIDEHAKRQQEIAQINATNSNKGITDQAATDRTFYGNQFDALRTSTLCKLNGLDATDSPAPCQDENGTIPPPLEGQLGDLRQALTGYTGTINQLGTQITTVRDALDTRINNLEVLMNALTEPADPADPDGPRVPVPPLDPNMLATLQEDITELKTAHGLLDSALVPNPDAATGLDARLADLEKWYTETRQTVKDAELTTSEVKNLEVKDWGSYDPDGAGVYVDSSDGLHQSITELVAQSAESSSKITSSKLTVPDNSKMFDALLKSATSTHDDAETVFTGVNELLTMGDTALSENQLYYQNFSTVLANTRTQGVDTGKIHDFFSSPIDAKNITPPRAPVAETFDLKLAFVFGGGLLAGVLVMVLGRTFRSKKET